MKVRTTLKAGDQGTKQLVKKYGEKLVTVRYRYDRQKSMPYKTVELIEEAIPWNPVFSYQPGRMVAVKISYEETEFRNRIKKHGGRWDKKRKVWMIEYYTPLELDLQNKMLIE